MVMKCFKQTIVIICKFLNAIIFILTFQIVCQDGFCQDTDCYYVKSVPSVFKQDSTYASIARSFISDIKNSIDNKDSLTLIGVSKRELLEDLSFMIENPN